MGTSGSTSAPGACRITPFTIKGMPVSGARPAHAQSVQARTSGPDAGGGSGRPRASAGCRARASRRRRSRSSLSSLEVRQLAHFGSEQVLGVRHWTDSQFTFTTTRDAGLRFANGQFVMLGLALEDRPLMRAYSIASANHEDHLEFLSIKVQDGPLTSRLQHLREGDAVLVSRKPTGTLLLDDLNPGKRLLLLATGTGAAPFLSLIQDPQAYERFDSVILVHGVRFSRESAVVRNRIERVINH